MERTIEKIPTWAISAIINDDRTGLTDDDEKVIDEWFETSGYDYICAPNGNAYFDPFPAFGLASDVYDCECVTL